MRVRLVAAGMALTHVACGPRTTGLQPLSTDSAARRYLEEFLESEARYPGGDRVRSTAPGGTAEVTVEREGGLPVLFDSCHSIWLKRASGEQDRIVTLSEADPGSGSSFELGWSRDAAAAFVSGQHSGIDCPWTRNYGDVRIIYTVADRVAWVVPSSEGHLTTR
jgi:hypothetical protein